MTWKDSYSIGIPQIDKQHKELCDQIDKLYDACSQGKGANEAGKVLEFLASYTIKHFADEEAFQKKVNYSGFTQHKAKHTAFLEQVKKLKQEAVQNGMGVSTVIRINQTISSWLVDHIKNTDTELKQYAN